VNKNNIRYIVGAVIVVAAFVAQFQFHVFDKIHTASAVPVAVELATEAPTVQVNHDITQAQLPSNTPTTKGGSPVRLNIWAWNAQMGLIYANGGPHTTVGSLVEAHGVRLNITRQDDTTKSQAEQIKFAQKLANGDPNPAEGIHFVSIMGDGAAQYLAGVNKALTKLGPDYRAEIVGSLGYSGNGVSGEDAFLGSPDWKDDATKAKGSLIAGVLRDGDWNIAMYWAQQNGIKNNPDETTYDPDALNWLSTDDYVKAAETYINGVCEDRTVVHDGKVAGGPKQHICVSGVVTWTPGDVAIAHKKGGLVKVLSTKENAFQMPAVVIGIHKWDETHAKVVEGILGAAFDGADQVRNFEPALQRAGKAAYAIYGEESPAYWVKYYKGVVEPDRTGLRVPLGGSRVSNLGDNLALFGLADGSGDVGSSVFRASYEGFGNIAKQQYPKLIPSFPGVTEAVNLRFLQDLAATTKVTKAEDVSYTDTGGTIGDVVGQRNWSITFETGKATFTPQGAQTLDQLLQALQVNKLYISVEGHTDNTGSDTVNIPLSKARAEAVVTYLQAKAPSLFPTTRFAKVEGYGSTKPIATNTTSEGKAQNRRVTITIGS
jgi:OmpA-OmpF porin, OOP family